MPIWRRHTGRSRYGPAPNGRGFNVLFSGAVVYSMLRCSEHLVLRGKIGIYDMARKRPVSKSIGGWRAAVAAAMHGWAGRLGRTDRERTAVKRIEGKPGQITLALQGGGAHGAFSWGVLDAMLEHGVGFEAISGSSAGAFNAVFMAHGWLEGGADGAREALDMLWRRIGAKAAFSPLRGSLMEQFAGSWNQDHNSSHIGFDLFTRVLSPYQFNPLDMNPLRELLQDHIDFDKLRRNRRLRLFIAATEVESGRLRVFQTPEITLDTVLASATLPWLHHAVEIDGKHYWDGGFTSNPPLMPLIAGSKAEELVLVRLDSGEEATLPVSARAIQARLNRIMFTGPLNRELDELEELRALARRGALRGDLGRRLRRLDLQIIDGGDLLTPFGQSSKLNPQRGFLREVHAMGRARAEAWLQSRDDIEDLAARPYPAGDSPCP